MLSTQTLPRAVTEQRAPGNLRRDGRAMLSNLLSQCTRPSPNLPSRGIQHPFRLTVQRIFDPDEVTQFIGERRDVVQRVLDRERLALRIHRDGRDRTQRIV